MRWGENYYGVANGIERFMFSLWGQDLGAALIVEGKPLIIDGGVRGNTGLVILDPTAPRDSTASADQPKG
ncbi:MAG: ROK family protein [Chloroflexi bacterium]|uniref:hypothetical protein n=1 Tax=Candidatus Flexifilum breve TaxID=3140694 RepID=UPI0031370318|nr:ROK family protein [Chloroflexota bacterium]